MATKAQLIAALKWALEDWISTTTYLGAREFNDSGCGCCSGKADLPPEHADAIREAFAEPTNPND